MHGGSAGALMRQPLRSCHRSGEESSSGRRRASWRRCARGDDGDPIKPEMPLQWRRIAKLETNIDDCSPQVVAFTQERLMKAGALDCYTTPIFMKKGRLGVILGVVCEDDDATTDALTRIIFEETTSLGVRRETCMRAELDRTFVRPRTRWGVVPVKIGSLESGRVVNVHPEHDVVAAIATECDVPAMTVAEEAVRLARAMLEDGESASNSNSPES